MRIIKHARIDKNGRRISPAIGVCNRCSAEVVLGGFTNTCECGADYNSAGQELAPRCFWGEETGESLSDIMSVDCKTADQLLEDE